MKKYFLLFVFSTALNLEASYAQKEINNWCFPADAGMDFNNGSPLVFNTSMSTTYQEGCSSISDINGNLLFYTDGNTIHDKNNLIFPNGSMLIGSYTTSQGALIVQQPGSTAIFYVFTLDLQNGPNGLHFSTVDLNLNGGLGDVSVLNTPLSSGTIFGEKMIGIRHTNNNDVWVVVHESFTDAFYSYLVTSGGVNPVPVITNVGQFWSVNNDVGTMHCTLDGTRIAAALWGNLSGYELYDFDKSTGILSNPLYLTSPNYVNAYSVCFSPGGRYMYGGCYNTNLIYQFDLQQAAPVGQLIANTPAAVGDMQIGPDSNIYLVLTGWNYVSAIYDPDSAWAMCNYVQNAVNLNGGACSIGITNFVYPVYNQQPLALFNGTNHICPGTCTDFNNLSHNATSYLWTFQGANPGTSIDANPTQICYNTPGNYTVSLIASNAIGSDTLVLNNFITVYPYPSPQGISQGGDTLYANPGATSYQWFYGGNIIPGATDYFYVAAQSGNYNIVATDVNGCEVEAAIFDVAAEIQVAVSSSNEFEIYPNPVENKLMILDLNSNQEIINSILIYNALGERVVAVTLPVTNRLLHEGIDCRLLSAGMYWLEIKTGNHIFRTKLLKN
ncbi:MAG: T9SS type A sorting domain-containing protein [Bacteroidota bacterium]